MGRAERRRDEHHARARLRAAAAVQKAGAVPDKLTAWERALSRACLALRPALHFYPKLVLGGERLERARVTLYGPQGFRVVEVDAPTAQTTPSYLAAALGRAYEAGGRPA